MKTFSSDSINLTIQTLTCKKWVKSNGYNSRFCPNIEPPFLHFRIIYNKFNKTTCLCFKYLRYAIKNLNLKFIGIPCRVRVSDGFQLC